MVVTVVAVSCFIACLKSVLLGGTWIHTSENTAVLIMQVMETIDVLRFMEGKSRIDCVSG